MVISSGCLHVVVLAGREQTHVGLPSDVVAWEGQPAADDLTGRHNVGMDGERIGHTQAMSRTETESVLRCCLHDGGDVGALILHARAFLFAVLLPLDGAALRVDAEEVGRGIVEIPFLSVDVAGFECLCLFPVVHLCVGDVGYVALDVLLHLVVGFVEVEGEAGLAQSNPLACT